MVLVDGDAGKYLWLLVWLLVEALCLASIGLYHNEGWQSNALLAIGFNLTLYTALSNKLDISFR